MKVTDRRIRKTRSNIFAALSALLARRESPDSISVTELCEKADISKSTFYLHFMDIYDCREQWADEYTDSLIQSAGGFLYEDLFKNPKKFAEALVDLADTNKQLYRQLSPEHTDPKHAINLKKRLIDKIIQKNEFKLETHLREIMNITLLVGGIFDFCAYNAVPASRRRVTDEMENLINACVAAFPAAGKEI